MFFFFKKKTADERRISDWSSDVCSSDRKWQHEEYRLGDDSGASTLLMPGVAYSYLRSDNRIDPSRGYRLQFEAAAAKAGVLSDADLVHANVQSSAERRVGEEGGSPCRSRWSPTP